MRTVLRVCDRSGGMVEPLARDSFVIAPRQQLEALISDPRDLVVMRVGRGKRRARGDLCALQQRLTTFSRHLHRSLAADARASNRPGVYTTSWQTR